MADIKPISIPLAEAQRLADLKSIRTDFWRCRDMCEQIVEALRSMTLGPVLLDGLATAIPIVYARPFIGGVRCRIECFVESLQLEEVTLHQSILHTRSKFTAHSVNRMENHQVYVWLNPESRGGRRINEVNIAQSRLMTLSHDDYLQISSICSKAVLWIEAEMAKESARLPAIILQKYTLESLYEMELDSLVPSDGLDRAHIGRSRSGS